MTVVGCITDASPAKQVAASLADTLYASCAACSELHYLLVDVHLYAANQTPLDDYLPDVVRKLFGAGHHALGLGGAPSTGSFYLHESVTDPNTNVTSTLTVSMPLYSLFGHAGSSRASMGFPSTCDTPS